MSTITQRIPNFLGGISQQPDFLKFQNQLVDCTNAYPDYALGLLKRPGGSHIAELVHATNSGKWFSILRDSTEKYIGQYADNKFRIWSLIDGSPRTVDMGMNTGVPAVCSTTNLDSALNYYNSAVALTKTRLAELNTAQGNYSKILAGQSTTQVVYLEPKTQYNGELTQSIKSGVLQNVVTNQYFIKANDTVLATGTGQITFPQGYSIGEEKTDEYPLLQQGNYRVWQLIQTVPAANTSAELSTALTAMNTAQTNYNNAVAAEASQKTNYEQFLNNCNITTVPNTAYLYGAAPEDIELLTLNDTTFVLNKKKVPAMKAVQTPTLPFQGFVVVKVVAINSSYTVTLANINGSIDFTFSTQTGQTGDYAQSGTTITCTIPNHGFKVNQKVFLDFTGSTAAGGSAADGNYTVVTATNNQFTVNAINSGSTTGTVAATIVTDAANITSMLAAAIDANADYAATAVGAGIHITSNGYFEISVKGSTSEEGLIAFTNKIGSVGKLPAQCKDGYKVEIVNSSDIDVDNMWVEFSTGGAAYGPGVWEECAAPSIQYEIDELTMPHRLIRGQNGVFYYGWINWNAREVGDNTTNPIPSFIGSPIKSIFFHRNRLGFLSKESVVLSKAGDYYNFFATTAQAVTDDDPIDITATSTKPVVLNYVQNTNVGLVLFGQNEQFILSTDATDTLSPRSANISTLSKYEADTKLKAVSLGTTIAFVSKTNLYSKVFEIGRIRTDGPPELNNASISVSELVPNTINSIVASADLSMVSLGETGQSMLYQYRFLESNSERQLSTWFKWQLAGGLLDQFFDNNTFYCVVSNSSKVLVSAFDLTQASKVGYLTLPSGEKTDVCLDSFAINPYRSYNSGTNQTTIKLPYDHITGKTLAVVALGDYIGQSPSTSNQSVGAVLYPTVSGSSGNYTVTIAGDYRGRDLIIGYLYDMVVELPKLYVKTSDGSTTTAQTTEDLIVHRIKVESGLSGPITYKIKITGLEEWVNTINVTYPNQYALNSVNLSSSSTHCVPIHQRNRNLRIRIVGNTPFPVTLNKLDWEGRVNTRYTRR